MTKGSNFHAELSASADDLVLTPHETYDATRIVVRMHDEFGNDLPFANDAIQVQVSEELQVIGPDRIALIGGSIGIYVRTTGKKGTGEVKISCSGRPDLMVFISVQ